MEPYVAKSKKVILLLFILPSLGLIFFGLDIRFFHTLESTVAPNHPSWGILCILGIILLAATVRGLLSPSKTLLRADSTGITVYSGGSAQMWDDESHSFVVTRRKWDAKTIPWHTVTAIEQDVLVTGSRSAGWNDREKAKVLKVLCDPSVKLEGFDMVGISKTWNGFEEAELRGMTKKERESLSSDHVKSGLLFRSMHLKGPLHEVIHTFETMRNRFGQQPNPCD